MTSILLAPDSCITVQFTITNNPNATTLVDETTDVYVEFAYDPDNWTLTDTVDGKPLARTFLVAGPDAPTPGSATVLTANATVRYAIGATTDGPPRPTGTVGTITIGSR